VGALGFLKSWFGSKPSPGKENWEMVERRLSIDEHRYKVRIKKEGREFYAEDLLHNARSPADLTFSRFFLPEENPAGPHFAPSLKEAVDWFTGRRLPKDGYNNIWWGDTARYECGVCKASRETPLHITQVEQLTVGTVIPAPREIVGWRVVQVESPLTGKGRPTKRLDDFKTVAALIWDNFPNRYLCGNCARRLTELGRDSEVAGAFVFEK
jgi:hypothetical protein